MKKNTIDVHYREHLETPIGILAITANNIGLIKVVFLDGKENIQDTSSNEITRTSKQQLNEYFLGQRKAFDLPLVTKGTPFQKTIWQCLLRADYGKSLSYKDIATMANNINAVRAVGAANGKNPISIIIPCHRIIGSNGTLTGYAGGLERKKWLLEHEQRYVS
jgi:methylated-DNA-[protein]-cysteine S-methyltransferase